jgi:predicted adenine nucleotide alpha hydrolase (AANH) superfamily ATPase
MMQEELKKLTKREKLLLHVCCGPCSSNVVKELGEYFDITIFYSNSNIYPDKEYVRRRDELYKFIKEFNERNNRHVEVIEDDYDLKAYTKKLEPLKDTGEKGERCHLCYSMRMQRAHDYALAHNFDYWTTVLSVSPHKISRWINEIGLAFQDEHLKFLPSDFKKRNGYLKSVKTSEEYHMYRQWYCGCVYSYQEALEREAKKKQDVS